MNSLKVYLSGSAKNVDEQFQNWRQECYTCQLIGYYPSLKFINPLAHFDYKRNKPKTDKQCLDLFMWLVDKSDILLVNLDHSENSIGTAMEVEHAYCNNIPIIAFGKKENTWYNWVVERASVVFDSLSSAIHYIDDSYGDINR